MTWALTIGIDEWALFSSFLPPARHLGKAVKEIDQFRYIKIQPKTIDLSTRFMGITTEFVEFIPMSLVLKSIVLG